MDEAWLQIRSYEGEGFQTLVAFNGWRVAILNFLDDIRPERNDRMERHTQTDEVFVLVRGRGILIVGGNRPEVEGVYPQGMETGKIYNVRRNTWHTILLSREASVLIVEERETGAHNSEYSKLPAEYCARLIELARTENIG